MTKHKAVFNFRVVYLLSPELHSFQPFSWSIDRSFWPESIRQHRKIPAIKNSPKPKDFQFTMIKIKTGKRSKPLALERRQMDVRSENSSWCTCSVNKETESGHSLCTHAAKTQCSTVEVGPLCPFISPAYYDNRVPIHLPPLPLSVWPTCLSLSTTCLSPSQAWNVLALDGSNWQKIDLFNFQTDIEVRAAFMRGSIKRRVER